jgi:ABC-type multidrug transport system ATPase subunit
VIAFRGAGKRYRPLFRPPVRALDDLTLEILPGEVMGIAGPNGAGKSTMINLILGFLVPSEGEVRIDGAPPRRYVERNGIGYLSELVAVNPRWRADQALARYALLAGVRGRDVGARVERALDELGLQPHRSKRVRALSKGNLQRLGLAQALLREERILVLDEPTHGFDPVWTQRFRDIVGALRRPDRAILIASHNLDELQRLADRVAILDRGRLQRIVAPGVDAPAGLASYRIVLAHGADEVAAVFPDAVPLGRSEFELHDVELPALNRGIAELIARGALLASVAPTRSSLERQFREAVGETG